MDSLALTNALFKQLQLDGNYSPPEIFFNLAFAVIFGFLLSLIYYRILHENSKSQRAFIHSLVLLPLGAAAVTLIIGNSLARAFGLLGAVSVVRFRTSVKNATDMAFVFMSITLGMACGSRLVPVGVAALLVFTLTVVILEMTRYGRKNPDKREFMVMMKSTTPSISTEQMHKLLGTISKSIKLQEAEINDSVTIVFKLTLTNGHSEQDLIDLCANVKDKNISELVIRRPE